MRQLQDELMRLRALQAAPPPENPPAKPAKIDSDVETEEKTSDAAVQQLRRLCRPRADGSLKVPPEVKQAFESCGHERNRLLQLLAKCNYNKDCKRYIYQSCLWAHSVGVYY